MMEKAVEERIRKLQQLEESLHGYLGQKQQVQAQLLELESAADALTGASSSYKIIGNIMVARPATELEADLKDRTERAKLRLAALERQEEKLKGQAESVQQEIMKAMKGDSHGDV